MLKKCSDRRRKYECCLLQRGMSGRARPQIHLEQLGPDGSQFASPEYRQCFRSIHDSVSSYFDALD